jgi:hypothetical protein
MEVATFKINFALVLESKRFVQQCFVQAIAMALSGGHC